MAAMKMNKSDGLVPITVLSGMMPKYVIWQQRSVECMKNKTTRKKRPSLLKQKIRGFAHTVS